MTATVKIKKTASEAAPAHNRRGIVHRLEVAVWRSLARAAARFSRVIFSRSRWLKNSSFASECALSSRFNSSPSFFASAFSASAEALSGSDASNSDSSRPLSWSSSHAVHFSSNLFIHVSQQILQFLARVKKARHDGADGAP